MKRLESLTDRMFAAVFDLSSALGAGFLKKVVHATRAATYKGLSVGEYFVWSD